MIKESIDKLIARNKKDTEFIESTYRQSADDAILSYLKLFETEGPDPALTLTFANILQCSSDPKLASQFHNQDIRDLLYSFLPLTNHTENIYIDMASFLLETMHDKSAAIRLVQSGIEKLQFQLKELHELYNEMNS